MRRFKQHRTTVDTICRVLSTAIAAAALMVAIASFQFNSQAASAPEVAPPTEINLIVPISSFQFNSQAASAPEVAPPTEIK